MTKLYTTFKPLIWIFITFFGLVCFFIWIEKSTGIEHKRALKNGTSLRYDLMGKSEELKKIGHPYCPQLYEETNDNTK